jgi:hypothetical protein
MTEEHAHLSLHRGQNIFMRIRVGTILGIVASTIAFTSVHAGNSETIESVTTGFNAQIGGAATQSFTPGISGFVTTVTVFPSRMPDGQAGTIELFAGAGPINSLGMHSFTWDSSPQVITLATPVRVTPGLEHTFQVTGMDLRAVAASDDPYGGGEAWINLGSWMPWSGCVAQNICPPVAIDFGFQIVVEDADADGDGVVDELDVCAATELPDPLTGELGTNRYSASIDGFAGVDGVITHTLADTAGCSAVQIIKEVHLGKGHLQNGITTPHLEAWIDEVGGSTESAANETSRGNSSPKQRGGGAR